MSELFVAIIALLTEIIRAWLNAGPSRATVALEHTQFLSTLTTAMKTARETGDTTALEALALQITSKKAGS